MVNAIGVKTQAEQFDAIELLKGKMRGGGEKKPSQDVKVSGESLQKKIASIKDSLDRPEEVRSSFSKIPTDALSDKFIKASAEALSDKFSKGNKPEKSIYSGAADPMKIRMAGAAGSERKKLVSAKPEGSNDVKRKDDEDDKDEQKKSKGKKETDKVGIMETELICQEDHSHDASCPRRIKSYREEEVPKQ